MTRTNTPPQPQDPVDYRSVYANSPIAQMVTRRRVIVECNASFATMFGTSREALLGQTVRVLYPTQIDFEHFGARVIPVLAKHGIFKDARAMQRLNGELFWVNVTGFSEYRDDPYAESLWVFSEMSPDPPPKGKAKTIQQLDSAARSAMTARERDVAALLIQNKTAKEIGRDLNISPRTVEVFRTRLLRKFDVPSTVLLVKRLLS